MKEQSKPSTLTHESMVGEANPVEFPCGVNQKSWGKLADQIAQATLETLAICESGPYPDSRPVARRWFTGFKLGKRSVL